MKNFTLLATMMACAISVSADIYVAGLMNGWTPNSSDWKLSASDVDGISILTKTMAAEDAEYEFKLTDGTWTTATGNPNRKFKLTETTDVTWYAKSVSNFICTASQMYVLGDAVGSWDFDTSAKLMTATKYEATWKGTTAIGDFKIVKKTDQGIMWDDITPANQTCSSAENQTITLDFSTMTVRVGTPVFKLAYGTDGQADWKFLDFSTIDGNIYTANVTVPSNMASLSFYVAYNRGAGDAEWVKGRSSTLLLSSIANMAVGTGTLTIQKNSAEKNWGISYSPSSPTANVELNTNPQISIQNHVLQIYVDGNAQFTLYNLNGQIIDRQIINNQYTRILNDGMYFVRINNKTQKVMVK